MSTTKFNNGPDLAGWAFAAVAAAIAFGLCFWVGKLDLIPATVIAAVVFVIVGVILGWQTRHRIRQDTQPQQNVPVPSVVQVDGQIDGVEISAAALATPAPVFAPAESPASEPAAVVAAAAPSSAYVAMVPEAPTVEAGPQRLAGRRGGVADNLQEIEGIGPAMERLCHEIGCYHFDQLAGWSDADVVWVDENMAGFRGRVVRDKWVEQARLIVAEGVDAFRIRAKTNDY